MVSPFRSYIIRWAQERTRYLLSLGKPQNDYLYKTTLSRRLLRFHQPGDEVYAQTMESFFIKVLKSPRSYDFLKQIELDDMVVNIKKF